MYTCIWIIENIWIDTHVWMYIWIGRERIERGSERRERSSERGNVRFAMDSLQKSSNGIYISISVSFVICMLILLLMSLAGLHFCVGLDFVTPSLKSF
jgi:hypothetical protein